MSYEFQLLKAWDPETSAEPPTPQERRQDLENRPFTTIEAGLKASAEYYVADQRLATAVNTAVAVGSPLLVTGPPGTGKTQAAYWAAHMLGLGEVIHFQVKSDSTARDFLYHFDAVRYFHDASVSKEAELDKSRYLERGPLWRALEPDAGEGEAPPPRVLLIDEIDKAPRDLPNDLLHELSELSFFVKEIPGKRIRADKKHRPLVFITSNSERRLPDPFLRRCVFHHIRFDRKLLTVIIARRSHEFGELAPGFVERTMDRFFELHDNKELRKAPTTGEFLSWLRMLKWQGHGGDAAGTEWAELERPLAELPYLATLIKDHRDLELLEKAG